MIASIEIPRTWVEDFLSVYESVDDGVTRQPKINKLLGELHVILVKELKKDSVLRDADYVLKSGAFKLFMV